MTIEAGIPDAASGLVEWRRERRLVPYPEALRTMEERVALYETMARHQDVHARALSARAFAERADEMRRHAGRLRDMLLSGALQPLQLTAASPDQGD